MYNEYEMLQVWNNRLRTIEESSSPDGFRNEVAGIIVLRELRLARLEEQLRIVFESLQSAGEPSRHHSSCDIPSDRCQGECWDRG